ncbi:excalibur calcium-binding domain-containing protein [Kitasatospora sp. NPDC051914]
MRAHPDRDGDGLACETG